MPKKLIEVKDVWKIYDMEGAEGEETTKVQALRGLNVTVNKGDFLVIMGPSGSGKSTAMNMVGCLDRPTHGHVLLDGQDISKMSESELAKIRGRKIGFVFQKFNLISSLSAIENVAMPLVFQGAEEEERIARARTLLESVKLGHRLYHRPAQMSGGEQQRVAIARALANNPEIILADEPTGNLDSKTGAEIMKMLRELHKTDEKTVVLITHDVNLKLDHEKVVYLKDGKNVERL